MRIAIIFILVFVLAVLFFFRENLVGFSNDLLQADLNPRLVNALQGDWALVDDEKTVFQIKRDTLTEIHNDSILHTNGLTYVFSEAAANYFTKDSSFAFSKSGGRSLRTSAFKLKEINKASKDTISYTLIYVSKERLEMVASDGATLKLKRY